MTSEEVKKTMQELLEKTFKEEGNLATFQGVKPVRQEDDQSQEEEPVYDAIPEVKNLEPEIKVQEVAIAPERPERKSRADSLFGEGWRKQIVIKSREDQERDYYQEQEGYWGLLYIECDECGKIMGYHSADKIKEHICKCGHIQPLKGLTMMYPQCQCGQSYRYRTNLQEESFEYSCHNCGSIVGMRINGRRNAYVTKQPFYMGGGEADE